MYTRVLCHCDSTETYMVEFSESYTVMYLDVQSAGSYVEGCCLL